MNNDFPANRKLPKKNAETTFELLKTRARTKDKIDYGYIRQSIAQEHSGKAQRRETKEKAVQKKILSKEE